MHFFKKQRTSSPPKYIKDYVKKFRFFGQAVFEKNCHPFVVEFFPEEYLPKKSIIFLHDFSFISKGLTLSVFKNNFLNFLKINKKNLSMSVK